MSHMDTVEFTLEVPTEVVAQVADRIDATDAELSPATVRDHTFDVLEARPLLEATDGRPVADAVADRLDGGE